MKDVLSENINKCNYIELNISIKGASKGEKKKILIHRTSKNIANIYTQLLQLVRKKCVRGISSSFTLLRRKEAINTWEKKPRIVNWGSEN